MGSHSKGSRDSASSHRKSPKKMGSHFLTPDSIAEYAVYMFFFTITGTYLIGILDVLPNLYKDSGARVVLFQRALVTLLFTEIMLNWFCIRYVDSSYRKYRQLLSALTDRPAATAIQGVQSPGLESTSVRIQTGQETDGVGKSSENEDAVVKKRFLKPSEMDFSKKVEKKPGEQLVLKYPYWSWAPCFTCNFMRPPRCHHCPICNTCVLKRDHHCYFTGSCVGWKNERYFMVFCFWAAISCLYALVHAIYYAFTTLKDLWRWFDLFPPLTILRCLLGYISPMVLVYVSVSVFLFYFVYLSTNFLIEHLLLINDGLTSFEVDHLNKKKIEIHDSRSYVEKMRAVFGTNWGLSVLFPLPMLYPTLEDPVNWPSVTVHRHHR